MADDVEITLDANANRFVVRIGDSTILMAPIQFEQLLEKAIGAAATHIDSGVPETETAPPPKGKSIETIRTTRMNASADLGAVHIVTRIGIGQLGLHFSCERDIVVDYCRQVMDLLVNADEAPHQPS